MNAIYLIAGFLSSLFYKAYAYYMNKKVQKRWGGVEIQYPYLIYGMNNLHLSSSVNIGKGSTIMCTRAPVIIKSHFVSGPNLTIITGDHMPLLGRFLDSVSNEDKERLDLKHEYDQEVIIEEDVWAGVNVTILKGVTVGRGSIIAAGSIVTKSIPPYSICAGIPAKVIKKRMTKDEIVEHETALYPSNIRLSKDKIEEIFA